MDLKPLKLALAVSILALCASPAQAQGTAAAPNAETVPEPEAAPAPGPSAEAVEKPEEPDVPASTPTLSPQAIPQEAECGITPAEITKLREPQFGAASSMWDILYAEEGMDVFADSLVEAVSRAS